jgi:hypothetical protein
MIKRKDYDTFINIKNTLLNQHEFMLSKRVVFIVTDEELSLLKFCTNSLERRLNVMKKALELFESVSK